MNREAFLDKGERVFVGTVAFVLAVETVCTLVGSGTQFAWPRLALGVFAGLFIIYLAQRLYGGDRAIETVALGWAGFQIVLTLANLVIGPAPLDGALGLVQDLGIPWRSLAALKLLAYGSFAASVAMRSSPRAFLAGKRGEEVGRYLPPAVADDSAPLTWTSDQAQSFGNLAGWMQLAAGVLILAGLYIVANAVPPSLMISPPKLLAIVEGVLLLALGGAILAPAMALGGDADDAISTSGQLQTAVQHLACWHYAVAAIGVGLLAVVVVRFLWA